MMCMSEGACHATIVSSNLGLEKKLGEDGPRSHW